MRHDVFFSFRFWKQPFSPRRAPAPRAGFIRTALLTLVCLVLVWPNVPARAGEKDDPRAGELLALMEKVEASYAGIVDYSAVFSRRERVEASLLPEERLFLKFQKPQRIYLKGIGEPLKEALYVSGENGGKAVVHKDGAGAGLTWNLDPNGSIMNEGCRHPITDIGFGFIIAMMRDNIPLAESRSELEVIRLGEENFAGRPAYVAEARFTPKDGRAYYASRIVLHVDRQYLLPVGVTCYDEQGALLEQYGYEDLKVNIGLTSLDFSRDNPEYAF